MKKALLFPGQGSQFSGMGKEMYAESEEARMMFERANGILGFEITKVMFDGTTDELKQTSVTQPAIYLHSVILARISGWDLRGSMAAGHSLGEFSALAAAGAVSFEDGLRLVAIRARAMQKACDAQKSTMAALVGMEDEAVEELCANSGNQVVPANYNSPGQLVISGSVEGILKAVEAAKSKGARMAIVLEVNGAFHSPFMEPARAELENGIMETTFSAARIPVYQNVTAKPETEANQIKENLISQLTAPVRWAQSIRQMISDGATEFLEVGPGNVLQGLMKRIDRTIPAGGIQNAGHPA